MRRPRENRRPAEGADVVGDFDAEPADESFDDADEPEPAGVDWDDMNLEIDDEPDPEPGDFSVEPDDSFD